jgi:hypothetical protein
MVKRCDGDKSTQLSSCNRRHPIKILSAFDGFPSKQDSCVNLRDVATAILIERFKAVGSPSLPQAATPQLICPILQLP